MALTKIDDRGLKTPIDLLDNEKIRLGTGNDLEIYHDGSNNVISGTVNNWIKSTGTQGFTAGSDYQLTCVADGAVNLYYDNSKKLETTSEGILVSNSSSPATFKITDTSGSGYEGYLQMRGNDMEIRGSSGQLEFYTGSEDGASSTLRGRFASGGNFQINNDAGKIELGTSQDLQIYHDGASKITNSTGALYIAGDDVRITNAAIGETGLRFIADGAVELYHNNHKSFNTGSTGISVYGPEGGNGSINLYADEGDDNADFWRIQSGSDGVWSLDNYAAGSYENSIKANGNGNVELYYDNSKKLETYSAGVEFHGNLKNETDGVNEGIYLGASNDLGIYHDGTHSWMTNATGTLVVEADQIDIRAINNEHYIEAVKDGAVDLYYDNSKKLSTVANGVHVVGNSYHVDAEKSIYGSGDDMQIFHENDLNYVYGSTPVHVQSNTIVLESQGGEDYVKCAVNGAVELYYDNAMKLETRADGVGISGDSGSCAIRLQSDGSTRGYFYANNSSETGHLNNSGGWKFKIENDGDYQFYGSSLSDKDLKDNITTVSDTSLDKITKLVPKTYKWKNLDGITPTDKTFTGFIAQEVKEHLPSLVTGTDGQKDMAVDYNGILAYAVKAITELSAEVETLKTKVAALEAA